MKKMTEVELSWKCPYLINAHSKINFLSLSLVVPASFFKIACIKIKSTAVEALFHPYTGPDVESTESFTTYIKNQFFSSNQNKILPT